MVIIMRAIKVNVHARKNVKKAAKKGKAKIVNVNIAIARIPEIAVKVVIKNTRLQTDKKFTNTNI
jgi:hypothetical protein